MKSTRWEWLWYSLAWFVAPFIGLWNRMAGK